MSKSNHPRKQPQRKKDATHYAKDNSHDAVRPAPPDKKSWSTHDMITINPMTDRQQDMFDYWQDGDFIFATGSAGTGKTFLSLYLGLLDLLDKDSPYEKIKIVRSIVQSRNIGFTPGDVMEKCEPYEAPYRDILQHLFRRKNTYENMVRAGKIEFVPTSFVRGNTWDRSIVIVDEYQNMSWGEIDSVITRIGNDSKLFLCGDHIYQNDIKDSETCAKGLKRMIPHMRDISTVHFTSDDIVRNAFVKQWIKTREKLGI